jgi:hypothetical protein
MAQLAGSPINAMGHSESMNGHTPARAIVPGNGNASEVGRVQTREVVEKGHEMVSREGHHDGKQGVSRASSTIPPQSGSLHPSNFESNGANFESGLPFRGLGQSLGRPFAHSRRCFSCSSCLASIAAVSGITACIVEQSSVQHRNQSHPLPLPRRPIREATPGWPRLQISPMHQQQPYPLFPRTPKRLSTLRRQSIRTIHPPSLGQTIPGNPRPPHGLPPSLLAPSPSSTVVHSLTPSNPLKIRPT